MTLLLSAMLAASAPAPPPPPAQSPLVEIVEGTGLFQLECPSFAALQPRQRLLAFWLERAAIALDPIVYDQLSAYGLREKRLIGAMVEKPERLPASSRKAIVTFAKLFFANRGNHNDTTNQKIIPGLTFEAFRDAARAAQKAGAPLGDPASLNALLETLERPLFDPAFEKSPTEKNPPKGSDIITASSNTFYGPGVTLADLKGFKEAYPLNSRIINSGGKLVEQVYRAGTPDGSIPPGLYAAELTQVIDALQHAEGFADEAQAKVLAALVHFYQSGDLAAWHDFDVAWVQNDATVDEVNGFIETYRDARADKGAAEALVSVTDFALSGLMNKIAANALYFERRAPWEERFKKLDVKPPVGKAVEVLGEAADFSVAVIGDNLPNEEDIHRKYGTKNFLMTNATEAFNKSRGRRRVEEFDPTFLAQYDKYGSMADNLHTAMHEIIGHGSGKSVNPKEPRETLREYYSTLEEARADLVAYWNITDPKLGELGVADQPQVASEMYRQLANLIFGVVIHYPTGDSAEEDHDRDRLLIWNWVRDRGGLDWVVRDGKHYVAVKDEKKIREAVGALLAELMRIKGEGDYKAIAALVAKQGIHFDPAIRDEIVARNDALNIPTYSAGIYADLTVINDASGRPSDVTATYPRDFIKQQLEYARINGTLGF